MNHNGILHFSEKDFSAEQAKDCELLFRVSADRLSYAIVNKQKNSLAALFDTVLIHPLAETFNQLVIPDPYIDFPFRKVKISAETFSFIFVPSGIFSGEHLSAYTNFVTSSQPSKLVTSHIPQAQLTSIANVGKAVLNPLTDKFPHAAISSQAEALIKGGLSYPAERRTLILQFNTGTFEALLLSGNDIIFYNIFSTPTTDDFNYFLLLIIKQLELERSDTSVLLSGEIEKYSGNFRRASKYFNNISFADSTRFFSFPEAFRLVPVHQFFALLSLALCE